MTVRTNLLGFSRIEIAKLLLHTAVKQSFLTVQNTFTLISAMMTMMNNFAFIFRVLLFIILFID